MIKHLTFSVTFPTEKSFSGDHDFHLGLGAPVLHASLAMKMVAWPTLISA